ncbi:hypothetical protein [Mucilaginibacter psychrotolerans]|uniref:Uncharacterized protein n=1 Tax=Mucilaginibacter psychrotolerans TaxID=1524096 RepID=A0A4Y8SMR7_9SPHI|nr:hypothetical protein [Mucilaginibacter psychrotolerans]TFF40208.1 hypothetical protein E2R66_02865 [Mucilaginibacter psychrotolerans]
MAFLQGFWHLDTYTILLHYIAVMILCGLYFYELLHYTIQPISIIVLPGFGQTPAYWLLRSQLYASFPYMAYKSNYNYIHSLWASQYLCCHTIQLVKYGFFMLPKAGQACREDIKFVSFGFKKTVQNRLKLCLQYYSHLFNLTIVIYGARASNYTLRIN